MTEKDNMLHDTGKNNEQTEKTDSGTRSSRRRFDMRAFISLALLWDFFILALSGVVLYIMPHGRVAYWIGWTFLGVDKDTWSTIHVISGYLMMGLIPFHVLVYNWAFVKHYFVKRSGGINLWREITASLVLVVVLFLTSLFYVFPSSTIMDAGEAIKESWGKGVKSPPVPHAESLTMESFAALTGMDLSKVRSLLEGKGLKKFSKSAKISNIAKELGVSPAKLIEWLEPLSTRKTGSITGGTYGGKGSQSGSSGMNKFTGTGPGMALGLFMNLDEYARKWKLDPVKVKEFLKKKGASDLSSVRAAAQSLGMKPHELHSEIISKAGK